MFLNKVSTLQIIRQQYQSKMSVMLAPNLLNLLLIQIIGIGWSFVSMYTTGTGNMLHSMTLKTYTGSATLVLTMLLLVFMALSLSNKSSRHQDFVFTTNRLTSDITNIMILLTFTVIGTIMSHFSLIIFRMLFYFTADGLLLQGAFLLTPAELGLNWLLTFSYTVLAMGAVYALNSLFVAYPLAGIGLLLLFSLSVSTIERYFGTFSQVIEFFSQERCASLLILKLLLTGLGAFILSILMNNRLEVRQ